MSVVGIFALALVTFVTFVYGNGTNYKCGKNECALNDTSARFFIIGDWGGSEEPPFVTKGQKKCAALMQNMSATIKPQFFISTGDNFYKYGVQNVSDPRFKETFDDIYLYGKAESIPWYVIAGNHDWYGNVRAQVEYSNHNTRWVFPSLSYIVRYPGNLLEPSVKFVFIDTVVLCGIKWDADMDVTDSEGGAEGNGPKNMAIAEELWRWIEAHLRQSKEQYLFVVGHYPAFSFGQSAAATCLVPRLQNLLAAYNASGYICGHSHTLQHMTTSSSTGRIIHYIVSGTGSKVEYSFEDKDSTENPWRLKSRFFFPRKGDGKKKKKSKKKTGGFVYANLALQYGTMEYYKCNGTLLYQFRIEPRSV